MDGSSLFDGSSRAGVAAVGKKGSRVGRRRPVRRQRQHGDQLGEAVRETGSVAPGKIGGHKPKKISGAHRDWLVERCRDGTSPCAGLWPNSPSAA